MPNLLIDQSIPALVWRGRTGDGQFNLKRMKDENVKVGSTRTNKTITFANPYVTGLHNGVPFGGDQQQRVFQRRELTPYNKSAKSPFLSDSVEDMYPRTYGVANPIGGTNGTIKNVASLGGAPLAAALNDLPELFDRVHNEYLRMDPKNPLSAAYALNHYNESETGALLNVFAKIEDHSTYKRKIAAGFLNEELLNKSQKKEHEAELNRNRNPTRQDILDLKDLFNRTDQDDPGFRVPQAVRPVLDPTTIIGNATDETGHNIGGGRNDGQDGLIPEDGQYEDFHSNSDFDASSVASYEYHEWALGAIAPPPGLQEDILALAERRRAQSNTPSLSSLRSESSTSSIGIRPIQLGQGQEDGFFKRLGSDGDNDESRQVVIQGTTTTDETKEVSDETLGPLENANAHASSNSSLAQRLTNFDNSTSLFNAGGIGPTPGHYREQAIAAQKAREDAAAANLKSGGLNNKKKKETAKIQNRAEEKAEKYVAKTGAGYLAKTGTAKAAPAPLPPRGTYLNR